MIAADGPRRSRAIAADSTGSAGDMNRRQFLGVGLGAAMAALAAGADGAGGGQGGQDAGGPSGAETKGDRGGADRGDSLRDTWGDDMFDLPAAISSPVKVASIDVLRVGKDYFVRATAADGAAGLAMTNERAAYLAEILKQLVIPCFVGQDARHLERLVDDVYVRRSNYKLAGLAFWNPVGWVEAALLDLLGKVARKSVGELLGGRVRKDVPVYMSSMRRDTTPQQEVDWVGRQMAETGTRACKLKVGGRMSRNADASPGRTEKLVALARKTFGDDAAIYVDANGSYDAAHAVEVGRILQAHRVAFLEEPCPWEELEETRRVTEALEIPVAGGEQDASLPRFRWMIRNRVVDVVQPDVNYNGGLIRTIRVARMAAAAKMPITPHSPRAGFTAAYMLHFASVTPNIGPHMEWSAASPTGPGWLSPRLEVKGGLVRVPDGPGLGLAVDPAHLARAEKV